MDEQVNKLKLDSGEWLNEPLKSELKDGVFIVSAKEKTDFWQKTSYGFVHNSGKAGVEFADGNPQLGAVVTRRVSDWSVAPVPNWMDKEVHIRFSRSGDALTIRAKCEGDWQLVRLAPLDPDRNWRAGIFLASPLREGLQVRFTRLQSGAADSSLH
jgi:regulation of enolase protein 1 (concanavalin A-like superfamily)